VVICLRIEPANVDPGSPPLPQPGGVPRRPALHQHLSRRRKITSQGTSKCQPYCLLFFLPNSFCDIPKSFISFECLCTKMGVPSHSAQERANPPPRRKSCAACIKAKRRCDFAMPACVRCSQRKIHCEYPSRGTAGQRESAKHVVGQDFGNSTVSVDDSVTLPGYDCLPDPDGNRNMALIELGGSENMHAETCTSDMSRLKLPIDMPEWWSVAEHSMPLKAPMSKSLNFASDAVRNRLQFSVDLLRSTPKMMVTDMQTPWYHPLLHTKDVPRSLQGRTNRVYT
jgi:hypothetical protein